MPTTVVSRTKLGSISFFSQALSIKSLIEFLTTFVNFSCDPGLSIQYETRLIKSSPNLICGFIDPSDAMTSPVNKLQRFTAIVVEPISIETPYIFSTKPGQ